MPWTSSTVRCSTSSSATAASPTPPWLDQLIDDPLACSQIPHIDYVREAGSEGIELVMWLIARGAMADVAGGARPVVKHRFYHVPASNTAVGHLILENP